MTTDQIAQEAHNKIYEHLSANVNERKSWDRVYVTSIIQTAIEEAVRSLQQDLVLAKQMVEIEGRRANRAEEDTKRLDWLSRYCYLPHDHPNDKIAVLIPESISPMGSFTCNDDNDKTAFRKAIDASMPEWK